MPLPVILIFDVGKTNKKTLLFDRQYRLIDERCEQLPEITDEDGFPCEDVQALTARIKNSFRIILEDPRFEVKAVNFTAYGASFVYLGKDGSVLTPLYNYLKPYPAWLQEKLYSSYGGPLEFSLRTASPVLGSLNAGMQLYRLKMEKPELFASIRVALHLPQYLSYILTGLVATDITSIGCHTHLWDFPRRAYHDWVTKEGLEEKFAPITPCDAAVPLQYLGKTLAAGYGMHDSSSALIPYLACFQEPFILLSTGTWCISMNPFNHHPLQEHELKKDCLCYLTYKGVPVKASRLFGGYEHEQQTKRLAVHFHTSEDYYKQIAFTQPRVQEGSRQSGREPSLVGHAQKDYCGLDSYEQAYSQLMEDIVSAQVQSTGLVLENGPVRRIFVDGGFSANPLFLGLLRQAFKDLEVLSATVSQATALGAALAMHSHWNDLPIPEGLIELK